MTAWADLRQVVIATESPQVVMSVLRSRLGLGRAFGDPELAAFGIADHTMAVGADTYLEVVSPTTRDHPIGRWLAKRGGSAGYLLSVQVSDVDACLARCEQLGVRVSIRHVVQGFHVAQLHPGDMGGSSVELDGLPERGRWFWDILEVDRPESSRVDDIVAVDIAATDPDALLARWSGVFGLDADSQSRTLSLGSRTVRFVHHDTRSGIVAADFHTTDRSLVGTAFTVGNVEIRLA